MPMTISRLAALSAAAMIGAFSLSAQADDLLDRLQDSKVITVGTSNDAPLSFVDSKTGEASGVLTDVLKEALTRMDIDAEIHMVPMPFSSLIPALNSDRIDLIGDGIYATPKRARVIDFTDSTFFNPESLDVVKGNPADLHSLSDLCGHSAGTYEGTTYVDLLKQASDQCSGDDKIDIKLYPKIQNALADLSSGRLDAAVVDSSLSAYALVQNPKLNFELVADYVPADKTGSACAFGVGKGNDEFVSHFNEVYAEMRADGTVATIFEKWGLTPTSFFLEK